MALGGGLRFDARLVRFKHRAYGVHRAGFQAGILYYHLPGLLLFSTRVPPRTRDPTLSSIARLLRYLLGTIGRYALK